MIKYLILMLYFTGAKAGREKIIYENSQAISDSHKDLALWFWYFVSLRRQNRKFCFLLV